MDLLPGGKVLPSQGWLTDALQCETHLSALVAIKGGADGD